MGKTLVLTEKGPPLKFNVTTTVPVVCENGRKDSCFLKVAVGQSENTNLDRSPDGVLGTCSIKFKPSLQNQSKEVEVSAVRDFRDDGDKFMYVGLQVKFHWQLSDWVKHRPVGHVKVGTSFDKN